MGSMTFTGSQSASTGFAATAPAVPYRVGGLSERVGSPQPGVRPLEPRHRDSAARSGMPDLATGGRPDPAAVLDAVRRTASWIESIQAADGHWRGPLEGDSILESEYLLILAWAGRLRGPIVDGCVTRLLTTQLPDGGWAIYPGGPVDVSASVKAYFALKLAGHDPTSPPLVKARRAIAAAGGPWRVNSFTRFYLALLGQMPFSACPAVPPEMVLLPDWFPVNLHRVSAWSRTMIVPLSLMWAFKPARPVPAAQGIAELFADARQTTPPPVGTGGWAVFFRGVDRMLKASEAVGLTPLRSRAVQACRRWMLERFADSDGLGAIFPPIVWSIVALEAVGAEPDSPEVRECWRQLDRLVERGPGETVRLEPCRSPVWDTALSLIALAEVAPVGGDRCGTLTRAVDWLLANEIRTPGDWARRVHRAGRVQAARAARKPSAEHDRVEPSGWCFEYANRFYPDVDDTAMVLIALATWRRIAPPPATSAERQRVERVAAAIGRGRRWIEAMQNSDGGWGAFDRDNNSEFLCKVPFADHNAMIDPSSPDLAGRVLEALGKTGLRVGHPAVDDACRYLRQTQEADGCWYGRWGVNYIYGTWQAVQGLMAVGVSADDPAIERAADWLESHQQADGGWGETPESYADRGLAGTGPVTPSQTAWAVCGLVAAGRADAPAVRRGVAWLVSRQEADGSWEEHEFTGTGFPEVFYLKYHHYPITFPLLALVRAGGAAVVPGVPR
jgi:squalene-hopene/tetraprenyl-beta-curcumene cyclase